MRESRIWRMILGAKLQQLTNKIERKIDIERDILNNEKYMFHVERFDFRCRFHVKREPQKSH